MISPMVPRVSGRVFLYFRPLRVVEAAKKLFSATMCRGIAGLPKGLQRMFAVGASVAGVRVQGPGTETALRDPAEMPPACVSACNWRLPALVIGT